MDEKNNQRNIRCIVADKRAVIPTRAHPSDIGVDLTVIDVWENEAACQKFLALVKPLAAEIGISLPQPEFYEVFSRPGT